MHWSITSRSSWRLAGACLAVVSVVCATWWFWSSRAQRALRGPIVLISIDTLRADRLPAYGYTKIKTPAIDTLASDGIVFERAYSHSPLTLPSHVSMLSGALPFQHGVRDNVGFRVREGTRLLPGLLREQGFATGAVVSASVLRQATGIAEGFDIYDDRMSPVPGGASLDEVQRDGGASLDVALRWMAARDSPRFFLLLHLFEPHAPYAAPARYAHYAAYDGEVAYADELVGRLLQALRDREWYDSALIVVLSDHGEGLGDHGEQEHGLFLYDEVIRVPLVVKMPGSPRGGLRIAQPVQHVDLFPTILDLAGATPGDDGAGRSLRPLLEGSPADWHERQIYSESLFGRYHFGWSEIFAMTDARYRFIRAPREELYDLRADPRERRNVAADRPQPRAALKDALEHMLSSASIRAPKVLSADARARLASLGYVGPTTGSAESAVEMTRPDPKDRVHVLVMYRRALELVATARFEEGLRALRDVTREEPSMSDVWRRAGAVLLRLGRYEEAIESYRQYVALKPATVSGFLELAAVLLKLRRFDEAEVHAKAGAEVASTDEPAQRAAAFETLAKIALARPDPAAARRYAELGQQADSGLPLTAYVEGRLAYADGQYAAAARAFETALEAMKTRAIRMPDLHLYAGDTFAHLGRFEEAAEQFRQEIKYFPHSVWAYVSLANLYQAFDRTQEAEQVLSLLVRRIPSAEAQAAAARLRKDRN